MNAQPPPTYASVVKGNASAGVGYGGCGSDNSFESTISSDATDDTLPPEMVPPSSFLASGYDSESDSDLDTQPKVSKRKVTNQKKLHMVGAASHFDCESDLDGKPKAKDRKKKNQTKKKSTNKKNHVKKSRPMKPSGSKANGVRFSSNHTTPEFLGKGAPISPSGGDTPRNIVTTCEQFEDYLSLYDDHQDGPLFVCEELYPTANSMSDKQLGIDKKERKSRVVSSTRLGQIKTSHIIIPTPSDGPGELKNGRGTLSVFRSLRDCPHCTQTKEEARAYVKALLQSKVTVCAYLPDDDSPDLDKPFGPVAVFRPKHVTDAMKSLPTEWCTRLLDDPTLHRDLATSILEACPTRDPKRGNHMLCGGYATDRSTTDRDDLGISMPCKRVLPPRANQGVLTEAVKALSFAAKSVFNPQTVPDRFCDGARQRIEEFAGTFFEGNEFEAWACSLICQGDGKVEWHRDHHNDDAKGMSHVVVFNLSLQLQGQRYRDSLIGYSRISIGHYVARRSVYQPVLRTVVDFHSNLPEELKTYGRHLLHPHSRGRPVTAPIHADKIVHYNALRTVIEQLLSSNGVDLKELARVPSFEVSEYEGGHNATVNALIYASQLTNNPINFWEQAEAWKKKELPTGEAAWSLVKHFHEKYLSGKKKKPAPGARHQPCANRLTTDDNYKAGLRSIAVIRATAAQMFDKGMPLDKIHKAVSEEAHGIVCMGKFTGQQLIGVIGLTVGPLKLLEHCEIAETTNTCKRMREDSPRLKEGTWVKHSTTLLKLVQRSLGVSPMVAENLCCEAYRSKKGRSAYSEVRIPGGSLVYCGANGVWLEIRRGVHVHLPFHLGFGFSKRRRSARLDASSASSSSSATSSASACSSTNADRLVKRKKPKTIHAQPSSVAGANRVPDDTAVLTTFQSPPQNALMHLLTYPTVRVNIGEQLGQCLLGDSRGKGFCMGKCLRYEKGHVDQMVMVGRLCDQGKWVHKIVHRAVLLGDDCSVLYKPDNFSKASELLSASSSFVCHDHRFFTQKRMAVQYLVWSALLNPSNRTWFVNRLVALVFSANPVNELPSGQRAGMHGRLLVDPTAEVTRPFAYFVKLPDNSLEVGLLTHDNNLMRIAGCSARINLCI